MSETELVEQLLRRVEELERRVRQMEVSGTPIYPHHVVPMTWAPPGCICPAGAEYGCGGTACPRRGVGGVRVTSVTT